MRFGVVVVALALVLCLVPRLIAEPTTQPPGAEGHPPELMALAKEFRQWRSAGVERIPDYVGRVAEQKRGLAQFRQRLEALTPRDWPLHAQVDYLVVQIEMDHLEFDLTVIRQASRNPNYYVTQAVNGVTRLVGRRFQMGPGITVPYDTTRSEALVKALNDTPAIVEQASKALTEAVPEMADMTIERLGNVRENYAEFGRMIARHMPESHRLQVGSAAERAGQALERYREWIEANRTRMTAPWAIGRAAFDWYISRVFALPYDSDDLLVAAETERSRNWAFLQFERQKNRHLPSNGGIANPPVAPPRTNAEYSELKDATDVLARLWAEEYGLFTRPDHLGPMRHEDGGLYIEPFGLMGFPAIAKPIGTQTEFLVPPDHWWSHVYWEKGHRLDPATNHLHNDYPGHAFERTVSRRTTCELRRDGLNTRGDAWPTYIEEVQLQLDYPFVRGPRVREWMYGLSILRAERVYTAVKFADGSMTPEQLSRHMLETVPWMEPYVAKKHEVWRKFDGNPADTLKYQVTKFEIYKLLKDRMAQLGDRFDLRAFHDKLFATGQVPVPLARWEMTGLDDEIKHLWKRVPIPLENRPSNQP